ncbi:hypothetical protein [Tumebacillus permanentifrigoris]|uniref:Uncharacterized protein n=1 Tax=Tumebacillus permanentifrigoris TaxID=378543 RepID=A0A316D5Z5_9BACL|nr:hypothetical protein [Tumebacillus permanentifrigoris]PWK09666.1 hypothetical protein C7459_113102 [Tumebacillus permanentifrigoris]
MMVIKKHNGTTEHGTEYAVVVARTSKSILPARHTTFTTFLANVHENHTPIPPRKSWPLLQWLDHFFRL